MSERVVQFGDGVQLSGIATEPFGPTRPTGVLLLGAGLLHRVGPARLHVKLARALGEAGFPVLRFDYSGIGESEVRADNLPYDQSVLRETRAAMEVLAGEGARRFLLFGICSGADNGLSVAVADERVAGVAPVALYTFPSAGYQIDYYVQRLVSAAFWRRLVRGGVDLLSAGRNAAADVGRSLRESQQDPGNVAACWMMPTPGRIAADFRTLAARGVRLLLVYSRPSPAEYNYRRLVRKHVASGGPDATVQVEIFTGTNHTLAPAAHQSKLIELVVDWARRVDDAAGA